MNRKISIKNALTRLREETDASVLRKVPSLIRWAIEADAKIGSYYDYQRKVEVVKVQGCKAEIPLGAVHVLSIVIGDIGCDCDIFFKKLLVANKSTMDIQLTSTSTDSNVFYWSTEGNPPLMSNIQWEIQDHHIVFQNCFDDQYVTILYLSYDFDTDGFPLVNETNIEAISLYLKLKLFQIEQWHQVRSGKYVGNFNTLIQLMKREVSDAIKSARAESSKPSKAEAMQLGDIFNNPITGYRTYLLEPWKFTM